MKYEHDSIFINDINHQTTHNNNVKEYYITIYVHFYFIYGTKVRSINIVLLKITL